MQIVTTAEDIDKLIILSIEVWCHQETYVLSGLFVVNLIRSCLLAETTPATSCKFLRSDHLHSYTSQDVFIIPHESGETGRSDKSVAGHTFYNSYHGGWPGTVAELKHKAIELYKRVTLQIRPSSRVTRLSGGLKEGLEPRQRANLAAAATTN